MSKTWGFFFGSSGHGPVSSCQISAYYKFFPGLYVFCRIIPDYTAAERKSWNDIFSNLSKGNDNGSSASGRESNPTGPVLSVNIRRKILTMRRKLLLDLKRLHSALTDCISPDHFFEHEYITVFRFCGRIL